jgi:hypothetical protein
LMRNILYFFCQMPSRAGPSIWTPTPSSQQGGGADQLITTIYIYTAITLGMMWSWLWFILILVTAGVTMTAGNLWKYSRIMVITINKVMMTRNLPWACPITMAVIPESGRLFLCRYSAYLLGIIPNKRWREEKRTWTKTRGWHVRGQAPFCAFFTAGLLGICFCGEILSVSLANYSIVRFCCITRPLNESKKLHFCHGI